MLTESLVYPTTQIEKECHTNLHSSPAICPSIASSSGNAADDVSGPTIPSGNFNRRRGKTLSSLDVFISRDISGSTEFQGRLLEILHDQKAQQNEIIEPGSQTSYNITGDGSNDSSSDLIAINHYEFDSQETDRGSTDEVSGEITDSTGGSLSDSISDGDVKDLARHGLPSACIFVANLAATQTDDQLMKSLQSHFVKFGRLHVKIRRDVKNNPYSFCQFESDETARLALRDGRNAIIDSTGRRIRCEPAKVNRTLVISKTDNNIFNERDTRKLLFGFGETETVEFARNGETLPVRGTKEGRRCFVRFAYRQDAVDCYQYFRHHYTWTAEWTSNLSAQNIIPRIQTVEIDPVSIFIGKLNPELTKEDELRARFCKYGTIVECNLVNRASKNGIGRNAFAFVKYETEEMANRALKEESNSLFHEKHIHVQKREIHKKPTRTVPHHPTGPLLSGPARGNKIPHMEQVRRFGVPQSVPFSMEAVADLAARLSVQLAEQRDLGRRPSGASMLSNQSVISQIPYVHPNDQLMGRNNGFHGSIPGLAFHQPFQPGYSGFHNGGSHQAIVQETPASPRTIPRATNVAISHDQPILRQQVDDVYSGAFPPAIIPHLQQLQQGQHLVPHVAMVDNSHHRESVISMVPFDPANCYGNYGNGYTAHIGYHMHHHSGS